MNLLVHVEKKLHTEFGQVWLKKRLFVFFVCVCVFFGCILNLVEFGCVGAEKK